MSTQHYEAFDLVLSKITALEARVAELEGRRSKAQERQERTDKAFGVILAAVKEKFPRQANVILAKSQDRDDTLVRHIAMYLLAKKGKLSLPAIGRFFKKHHTTVLYGVQRIEELVAKNVEVSRVISELEEELTEKL